MGSADDRRREVERGTNCAGYFDTEKKEAHEIGLMCRDREREKGKQQAISHTRTHTKD